MAGKASLSMTPFRQGNLVLYRSMEIHGKYNIRHFFNYLIYYTINPKAKMTTKNCDQVLFVRIADRLKTDTSTHPTIPEHHFLMSWE